MTVDAVLLRRKLTLIAPDLTLIAEQIRPAPIADHDERIRQLVLERLIERVVGRVIDINFHVVTASGEPPPRDYYASFALAAKAGAIASELATALAPRDATV